MATRPDVEHLDPEGLPRSPAYTNVVTVGPSARTVYVGGQNAVTGEGELVGRGDIAAQTQQVLANLRRALAAAGAEIRHVVKWTVYIVQGHALEAGFLAFQRELQLQSPPPTITVVVVAGLANPEYLVEVDAVAAVPDDASP